MSATKSIVLSVSLAIFSGFSCSEKSNNPQRTKVKLAAEIKDVAAAATMNQLAIGDINTTSPSTLENFQNLSFHLKNLSADARKVGLTDQEINLLIKEGELEGRRAMLEIIQQSNRQRGTSSQ